MSERVSDDDILIRRSQGGDRSAFDTLVKRHEIKAFQYAFRLTRNSEEAADVVSDAFIRVYNALGTFKGQSSFSTWMYRILTNCFLDIRKKVKPTTSLEVSSQSGEGEIERQIEDWRPTPHEESERIEREERVERAVNRLPEYQRAMIVMYHVDMLTYEEIAEALDLPIGTVKSRLNRARLTLRDFLIKDQELFKI
ncbi:MAG TPA: sigma-70 family RNA polymerase sigma factor [Fimbriimonadaceae bacterium]|nr:sigma-70 family RNA polymerase sigma factor [Fimbriimonadaceae bacterium]